MEEHVAYAQNPYFGGDDEGELARAPFAGRQAAFTRLYQTLSDPAGGRALLITGRARVGRTSLLYAFDSAFGESMVSALVPLRSAPLGSEMEFVLELAQDITAGLIAHDVPTGKLSDLKPPAGDARLWLEDEFLPAVFHHLRLRRLALLIDDADRLVSAILAEDLPDDLFSYLRKLLEHWPALGIVVTAPDDDTLDASSFSPLVTLNDHVRLMNLAPDETRWLIQAPVRSFYSAPDAAAAAVQRATGGAPALVQQFGYHLFKRWEASEGNVLGLEDVRAVTPRVYQAALNDFRRQWSSYTLNERLVLTAITDLIYEDPLDRISVPVLQTWLTDTDYPLDTTAILSALRSLEYNEIVAGMPDSIVINSGMLQTWLLENARLQGQPVRGEPVRAPASAAASAAAARSLPADGARAAQTRALPPLPSLKGMPRRAALLLAALLVIAGLLGAMAAFSAFGGEPAPARVTTTPLPAPTVTLVIGQ
jgi:hypothetical protein